MWDALTLLIAATPEKQPNWTLPAQKISSLSVETWSAVGPLSLPHETLRVDIPMILKYGDLHDVLQSSQAALNSVLVIDDIEGFLDDPIAQRVKTLAKSISSLLTSTTTDPHPPKDSELQSVWETLPDLEQAIKQYKSAFVPPDEDLLVSVLDALETLTENPLPTTESPLREATETVREAAAASWRSTAVNVKQRICRADGGKFTIARALERRPLVIVANGSLDRGGWSTWGWTGKQHFYWRTRQSRPRRQDHHHPFAI
jgi:hypothetical protein